MKRVIFLLAFAFVARAAEIPVGARGPLGEMLGEYLHRAEAFGFSGSVLVAKNGEVVLHQTYGFADRARGIRLGPHMPLYVASVSKPFTAAAILRLEMDGKLAVTDSIAKHLPNVLENLRAVTIHHLLTHTSGLDAPDLPHGTTRDAFIAAMLTSPPQFKPGERYRYSNGGYALLAATVERASGETFASYLHSHILGPAGMNDTVIATETKSTAVVRAERGGFDQGDAFVSHYRPYSWDEQGATGLVTTAADLYRWDVALRGTRILSDNAKRKYQTAQVDGYAYGWATATTARNTRLVMHQGLLFPEGWNAELRRYLDDDVVVIVLSNVYRAVPLSEPVTLALTRIVFGGEVTFPPPVASRRASDGTYILPSGGSFIVRDGMLEPIGQDAVNLLRGQPLDAFAAQNERTRILVEAIARDALDEMKDVANDRLRTRLAETWRGLVARFGPFVSSEVLHTIKSDDDEATTTFVRLRFERAPTVGRYIWQDGKLIGSFDLGSFEGPMQQVEVIPAPMPLVAQPSGGYATWDFADRTNVIRFVNDTIVIGAGDKSITARRQR